MQFLEPIQTKTSKIEVLCALNQEQTIQTHSHIDIDAGKQYEGDHIIVQDILKHPSTATLIINNIELTSNKIQVEQCEIVDTQSCNITTLNNINGEIKTLNFQPTSEDNINITNLTTPTNIEVENINTKFLERNDNQRLTVITNEISKIQNTTSEIITCNSLNHNRWNSSTSSDITTELIQLETRMFMPNKPRTWLTLHGRINNSGEANKIVGQIGQIGSMVYGFLFDGSKIEADDLDTVHANGAIEGPASAISITWNGRDSNRSFTIQDNNGQVQFVFNQKSGGTLKQHWTYFYYQVKSSAVTLEPDIKTHYYKTWEHTKHEDCYGIRIYKPTQTGADTKTYVDVYQIPFTTDISDKIVYGTTELTFSTPDETDTYTIRDFTGYKVMGIVKDELWNYIYSPGPKMFIQYVQKTTTQSCNYLLYVVYNKNKGWDPPVIDITIPHSRLPFEIKVEATVKGYE